MSLTRSTLIRSFKKVHLLVLLIVGILIVTFIAKTCITQAQKGCSALLKSQHYATYGTLDYLERPPAGKNTEKAPLVFALHGLGHHKEGFSSLAKQLPDNWRIIFLNAPFQYRQGRAWYRFRCPQAEQDLNLSVEAVLKTVSKLNQLYPQSQKPALFGFSQGGVMTMALLNKQPQTWVAGANFSGYWLSKQSPSKGQPDHLPPLLLIHGERDRVVPFDRGLNAAQIMSNAGYMISWLPFAGGHNITQVGLQALVSHFKDAWTSVKTTSRRLSQE